MERRLPVGCASSSSGLRMGEAWFVQNMRVNHRRGNVAVPKQLLNRTNILPIFQQVSRETVPPRKSFAHAVGVIGFLLR